MGERAKVDILEEKLISFTQINCIDKAKSHMIGFSPDWLSVQISCALYYLKCNIIFFKT